MRLDTSNIQYSSNKEDTVETNVTSLHQNTHDIKDTEGNRTVPNEQARCKIDTGLGTNVMPLFVLGCCVQPCLTPLGMPWRGFTLIAPS